VGVFHVKHEGWDALAGLGLTLDEAQIEQLERFENLLDERALPRGMISQSDAPRLRERHILDSLRVAPLVPEGAATGCDMGSGAGLPGVPLAIARPELQLTLVEVRRTRAAFLDDVVVALDLGNVTVYPRRMETFRERVDVCFARAFGSADTAWALASAVLSPGGSLVYWAGERFDPAVAVPPDVRVSLFPTSALARSGSLAIMSAQ
jgi:16S rRNA (guanine527-N7)-methyltransferase